MSMKRDKLPECFVVLGHLMSSKGELGSESKARVDKLIDLLREKENQKLFFCGWDYREDCNLTIAEALKKYFEKFCTTSHQIFLSDYSRDTVGDAIFLKKFFHNDIKRSKINIVTSNYHCNRAKFIFSFIFDNKLQMHPAEVSFDEKILTHEDESLKVFKKTFGNSRSKDIEDIYNTLLIKHPYYNGTVYEKMN